MPFWVAFGRDLDERSVPRELAVDEDQDLSLPGRWVNSHELRCGDVLVGRDGHQRIVLRVEQEYVSAFLMLNLTIQDHHTYAVGPDAVLVHNTAKCGPAASPTTAKKITVSKSTHAESAKHIQDAQAAGHPKVLTLDRPNAPKNRAEALQGHDKVPGKQLDEYPPAFTKEGGQGASVRPISSSDNMGAGARIGNLSRGLDDGEKIVIEVID
jgi:hypothetical protein